MSWEGTSLSMSVFLVQHQYLSTSTDPARPSPAPLQAFLTPQFPVFGAMPAPTFSSTPLAGKQEQDRTRQVKAHAEARHNHEPTYQFTAIEHSNCWDPVTCRSLGTRYQGTAEVLVR